MIEDDYDFFKLPDDPHALHSNCWSDGEGHDTYGIMSGIDYCIRTTGGDL